MRTTIWTIALVLAGCGAGAVGEGASSGGTGGLAGASGAGGTDAMHGALPPAQAGAAEAATEGPEADLPQAPWSADPVSAETAPRELMAAWSHAENREWCAVLAPTATRGVRARRSAYDGGWAVEFDKRGMPGVTQRGRACSRCGRGAFGIAGTAMSIEDEDPTEAEETVLADGSRVRIEVGEGEEPEPGEAIGTVATLKIKGQDCVYQVWSFGGHDHLQELLRDLRFVR